MGFLSQIANIFTGSEDAKARKEAGELQFETAQQAIREQIAPAGASALSRFDPLAGIAQRGVDLSGFLADPQAQADFAANNPLFQLGLENLNTQTGRSSAARGRLTAGDTLMQLQNNATLAAQPLIDRQRQDILNLLNLGQSVAGQQAITEQNTAQQITDLLTGGAAAKAGGIVGAQNARTAGMGNLFDLATSVASNFAMPGSGGLQ